MVFETNDGHSPIAYKLIDSQDSLDEDAIRAIDLDVSGFAPDVAYISSTSWVIVYESDGLIYAQIFTDSGSTRDPVIEVSPTDGVTYLYPMVAVIN